MKMVRVEISDFGRIRSALVEFGEGLNVLYGPNDRGKTTVAEAIRAALLLPHGSTYAGRFIPWDRDARPRVRLLLQTDDGDYWRIDKTFARGSGGASLLETSRDGATFNVRAKGRQVDAELRALLSWGIAGPGGKNAPRGLPESFLTHVLLGPQENAPDLLTKRLDDDSDEAGRQRLIEALQVLAQDEIFKRVLDAATSKVDEAFTPTGKPRRSRGAPLLMARDEVREARERRDEALAERNLACSVMEERTQLVQHLAAAKERRDTAAERLASCRRAFERSNALRAARSTLEKAHAEHQRLVELQEKYATLQEQRGELEREDRARVETAAEAERRVARTHERLAHAQAAVRIAATPDAERERTLQLRELEAAREVARRNVEIAKAGEDARARQIAAVRRRNEAAAAHSLAAEIEAKAQAALAEAQQRLALLERARDWLERERLRARVQELRAATDEATRLRNEAQALRQEAALLEDDLPEVPTAELLADLEALAQELALAEARLDVGLSVALRRKPGVTVEAEIDDVACPIPGDAADLEGRRRIRLRIGLEDDGPLADLVITGGDLEARAEVERLRARWEAEAAPMLEGATLQTLRERVARLEAIRRRIAERRAEAEQRERRADELEARGPELEEWTRRLACLDAESGAMELAEHGVLQTDEASLRKQRRNAQEARDKAADALKHARQERQQRAQDLAAAEREVEVATAAEVDAPPLEQALCTLSEVEASLARLAAERAAAAQSAERELQQAQQAVAAAEAAMREARHARERSAAALSELDGRLAALREHLATIDEQAARDAVSRAEHALRRLDDGNTRDVDDRQLADAERALHAAEENLAAASRALARQEGRLEQVGGMIAEERYNDAQEALALAEQRQREVETDYNAYKLLVEAMRASEQEQSAHLGQALTKPVSEALERLLREVGGDTARYGALVFGATLAADGVTVMGDLRSAGDLSAGTREQIATLLRLTIARCLRAPLVLDDHLTHSDSLRVEWFRGMLREVAHDTQVLVITCHPTAYLDPSELAEAELPHADRADGLLRAIDATQVIDS